MLHINPWLLRLLVPRRRCAAFLCTLVLFGGTVLLACVNLYNPEEQALEAQIPDDIHQRNVSFYFLLVTGQRSNKLNVNVNISSLQEPQISLVVLDITVLLNT